MKLNYEWSELQQHAEDKDYFWTELSTPFAGFIISTSYTEYMKGRPGMYDVRRNGVIKKQVNSIEEGKEWVGNYLIKQTKLVLETIVPGSSLLNEILKLDSKKTDLYHIDKPKKIPKEIRDKQSIIIDEGESKTTTKTNNNE